MSHPQVVALFTCPDKERPGQFREFEELVKNVAEAQDIANRNSWTLVWYGNKEDL